MIRLRVTPLTWPELKVIVNSHEEPGGELYKLGRNYERQKIYRAFREQINDEWESIYDYLLCKKFGFDWVWSNVKNTPINDNNDENEGSVIPRRKKKSKPTFQEYMNIHKEDNEYDTLKLCINDFPYYYLPGIQHWILWKLGGELPTSTELANAKKEILKESTSQGLVKGNALERIINDDEVFLHWINPPHLRSLPGIDHVHILFNGELEL